MAVHFFPKINELAPLNPRVHFSNSIQDQRSTLVFCFLGREVRPGFGIWGDAFVQGKK